LYEKSEPEERALERATVRLDCAAGERAELRGVVVINIEEFDGPENMDAIMKMMKEMGIEVIQ